ncbi:MAG: ROK family protein [Acidobacteriota bacterium]|jgi:glucokinase|nr:ROK family protein [Acidobacteriota bacterium]
MKKVILTTDLGGTNLRMAAVCNDGEILSRVKYTTPRSDQPEGIVEAIGKAAEECKSKLADCEVAAIAAAVPGTINFEKGLINQAPNLPELDGFKMVSALEDKLNIKAFLENDANAAAVGESWLGASKGFDNSIMVTLGTGVGGGIIIDGKILRGIDGTGGEIGHINVEPKGFPCGCGSFGCVEQYASATAVVRIAKEIMTEKPFTNIEEFDDFTSEDIYEIANNGSDLAKEVFRQQGFYLGIMLAGLINSLNPGAIVIGGGAAAGWDLFIESLREQIKIRSYCEPATRVKIMQAKLGDNAGILGVAKLGFEQI